MAPRATEEYQRRGIDTVILENERLRVEVLAGKGSDITEIRDKRTDTNILFEAPHEWRAPSDGPVGAPNGSFTFLDYYPGGWQTVLPGAGGPSVTHGAPLALHGESSLVPWETEIRTETADEVRVAFTTEFTRYPFAAERELALPADSGVLTVIETIENRGEVPVSYSWLQHVALGEPLISPEASLSVDCETVLVDPEQRNDRARLPAGETFEWPVCETDDGRVDLREFPPYDERIHDLVALTDLHEGEYTVSNPEIDLGVTVSFPADFYEYLWYWQPFGGFEESPFFGRNYNVGLEPCTSIPNAGLSEAVENGTAVRLSPGERCKATMTVETHSVR